ncbi:unnamed protein product [Clavelina lepadiformis]|uniref:F5/8 type C domain-containing protein n=1 Tax=Clavelina lepadiformis TaxID=159417 RepID=A0ABP0EYF0_CLALP
MTSLIAAFLALVFAVNLAKLVLSQNEQICLPVPRDALGSLQSRGPQGLSGKRGIPGSQGPQGTKGNPGPPGQCQCDQRELVEMREVLTRLLPSLRGKPADVLSKLVALRQFVEEWLDCTKQSNNLNKQSKTMRNFFLKHFDPYSSHYTAGILQSITFVKCHMRASYHDTSLNKDKTCKITITTCRGGGQNEIFFELASQVLPKPFKIKPKEVCLAGVKSGKVRDDEMTASSIHTQSNYAPHEGRLDGERFWPPHSSKQQTPGEWLQVDLRTPTTVTGVVTQGGGAWWVTSFKILFGNSTNHLQVIQDVDGNDMQTRLCRYSPTRVLRSQSRNFVQVSPCRTSMYSDIMFSAAASRVWNSLPRDVRNVDSFKEVCLAGVKRGKVRDDEMTASSTRSHAFTPHGRLDNGRYWIPYSSKHRTPGEWLQVDLRTPTTVTGVVTHGGGAWRMTSFKISFGDTNNQLQAIQDVHGNDMIRTPGEWHQADLRTPTTVTGVVTQGSVGWRVTSFKISFGNSNNHLQVIQDVDGNDMIFQDNTEDTDNHVQNIFSTPIRARFIRLIAVTFNRGIVLRLDYLTC